MRSWVFPDLHIETKRSIKFFNDREYSLQFEQFPQVLLCVLHVVESVQVQLQLCWVFRHCSVIVQKCSVDQILTTSRATNSQKYQYFQNYSRYQHKMLYLA
jgi:hypothetical protein